jgi:hypothetical protein
MKSNKLFHNGLFVLSALIITLMFNIPKDACA